MAEPDIQSDGSELEYHTDIPVGEILRRTRVHYGLTLADVEKALRIRETLIKAIEINDTDQLPGRVYAIGFVRTYSEYLGFDGDRMVQLFKSQSLGGRLSQKNLHFPVAASDNQTPSLKVILGSIGALLALFVGWWLFSPNTDASQDVRSIPAVNEVFQEEASAVDDAGVVAGGELDVSAAAVSIEAPDISGQPETQELSAVVPAEAEKQGADETQELKHPQEQTQAQGDAQEGILLNVIENSWVEIRDENSKPIVSRVLKAGERYYIPSRPDLIMTIGNAGGLQILVDGEQIPALGERGEIKKNIQLDSEKLKALASSEQPQ